MALSLLHAHPNIPYLVETFEDPIYCKHFILQMCSGGDLGTSLRHKPQQYLEEGDAARHLVTLVQALAHCHQLGTSILLTHCNWLLAIAASSDYFPHNCCKCPFA